LEKRKDDEKLHTEEDHHRSMAHVLRIENSKTVYGNADKVK